ncbi:MAG: hypothetical protein QOJ13_1189 [Gaiellales bacterium]|nr:hypothetical protein [Gaiellales bacterium]
MTQLQRTVSIRADDAGKAAAVAGQVVLAMALRAGFSPLTADRLGVDVAGALSEISGPLELALGAEGGRLEALLGCAGPEAPHLARSLDGHGASVVAGGVELVLTRTELRAV